MEISPSELPLSTALRLCKETTDIDVIIELTKHENARVRKTVPVSCEERLERLLGASDRNGGR